MRKPMTFPVRYVIGKRLVDTFARELSEQGVLLSCTQPPPAGTIIGMQLFLPSGIAPCAATGVVAAGRGAPGIPATEPGAPPVEALPRGAMGTRTFWAEFTGLTRSSDAVISALLRADQRSSRRPAVNFKVRCRLGEQLIHEPAQNLSLGGVFVRARTPPPPDTIVEAQLELPDGKPPARVRGRVAHASARGFGLQFLDGEEGFRPRIEALVNELCARSA